MIFKTMPQNGASWLKPLLYNLEFEQKEEQVEVEIYDLLTSTQLGKIMLYNTASAEIDIAPYIRSQKLCLPLLKQRLMVEPSQDACRIVLRVNNEESQPIVVFRSEIGEISPRMISSVTDSGTVAVGETIRFTLLARNTIKIIITWQKYGGMQHFEFAANGVPCDAALHIHTANVGDNVVLRIECDDVLVGESCYRVVERDDSAVRLTWINSIGGMECCTFPQSVRRNLEVKSEDVECECGWYRRVVSSTIVRRLILPGATQSEVDSVLDILLSPKVYRCDIGEEMAVQLLTDTITYDDHGKLRRLEFDITEEWKGGTR